MLGSSMVLPRGVDSLRGNHRWVGTPVNQSSVLQVSYASSHWKPHNGALVLSTDGFSLGKEAAPFDPCPYGEAKKAK